MLDLACDIRIFLLLGNFKTGARTGSSPTRKQGGEEMIEHPDSFPLKA